MLKYLGYLEEDKWDHFEFLKYLRYQLERTDFQDSSTLFKHCQPRGWIEKNPRRWSVEAKKYMLLQRIHKS